MGFNFFLYGVYSEGQPCHDRFKNFIKNSQPATVKGTIYKLQCGLSLILNEGENTVSGQAVELDITESQWPLLDGLNGCGLAATIEKSFIIKETLNVFGLAEGEVKLPSYCLNPLKKEQTLGALDEFEASRPVQQTSGSLLEKLTDRQRIYIHKLSRAKGREIIPVDMALYRELISLELIVDKGRRLALTNLGHEVSHFL